MNNLVCKDMRSRTGGFATDFRCFSTPLLPFSTFGRTTDSRKSSPSPSTSFFSQRRRRGDGNSTASIANSAPSLLSRLNSGSRTDDFAARFLLFLYTTTAAAPPPLPLPPTLPVSSLFQKQSNNNQNNFDKDISRILILNCRMTK